MVISDVIKKIQGFQNKYGDIQIRVMKGEVDVAIESMNFVVDNKTLYLR